MDENVFEEVIEKVAEPVFSEAVKSKSFLKFGLLGVGIGIGAVIVTTKVIVPGAKFIKTKIDAAKKAKTVKVEIEDTAPDESGK